MKWLLVVATILICAVTSDLFAQRTTGTSRDPKSSNSGSRNTGGRSEESRPAREPASPAPAPVVHDPPPPQRHPPLIVSQPPVVVSPTVVVIVREEDDNDEAEVRGAVLYGCADSPETSGFDFSGEDVVSCADATADIHFSTDGPEFLVREDTDIRELRGEEDLREAEFLTSSEWSVGHSVHASPENIYVVWTWDNQYYAFRVVALSEHRVSIEWWELDEGSRRASSVTYRDGISRRNTTLARFGR